MSLSKPLDSSAVSQLIAAAGPAGVTPEAIEMAAAGVSRSTINRRLADLVKQGTIKPLGAGRATRYVSTSPFTRADIDAYFNTPWQQRPVASFNEELLAAVPDIDAEKAGRCAQIQAIASPMDKRFLSSFVIDLSWGSSALEGGTYSNLDTRALIEYGHRNKDKPTADAVLVLNHKRAAEHLWRARELTVENACTVHALLTDDHGIPEAKDSDHFLPEYQRGQPRDLEDVNLANSAYIPPFRPGTRFARQKLAQMVTTANALAPVNAALYLMTRIPYLQVFANGNKRTSRLMALCPLLKAGMLPFSFSDVDKADYIRGMAAFYELGSMHVIEQTFIHGYARSVVRGSDIPASMRTLGFDVDAVTQGLVEFINTGRTPKDHRARMFVRTP